MWRSLDGSLEWWITLVNLQLIFLRRQSHYMICWALKINGARTALNSKPLKQWRKNCVLPESWPVITLNVKLFFLQMHLHLVWEQSWDKNRRMETGDQLHLSPGVSLLQSSDMPKSKKRHLILLGPANVYKTTSLAAVFMLRQIIDLQFLYCQQHYQHCQPCCFQNCQII